MNDAPPLWLKFVALDKLLVSRGFTPCSPLWRETIETFLRSGKRELVVRCGRRAGKSTTLSRLLVCIALYGDYTVPPGEIHEIALLSDDKNEASKRLVLIKAILDALNEPYEATLGEIYLPKRRIQFTVFAASVKAPSGHTMIACLMDEVAKWANDGRNPAEEILATMRPTLQSHAGSLLFIASSPMAHDDLHAKLMAEGDTPRTMTVQGATWDFNPSPWATKEETRKAEPNEARWLREWGGIPSDAINAAFISEHVKRAAEPRDWSTLSPCTPVIIMDPASLVSERSNAFTVCVARMYVDDKDRWKRWRSDGRIVTWPGTNEPIPNEKWKPKQSVLRLYNVQAFKGGLFGDGIDNVTDCVRTLARSTGARVVHSDQRDEATLRVLFNRVGLNFESHTYSNSSKIEAVERARRLFRESLLSLPPLKNERGEPDATAEAMQRELLSYSERLRNGTSTYGGKSDDLVSLVITAMMALSDISGNPIAGVSGPLMQSQRLPGMYF